MRYALGWIWLAGCGGEDPDGPLRVKVNGTLTTPDGDEVSFDGSGRDKGKAEPRDYAFISVFSTSLGVLKERWALGFEPVPGLWADLGTGEAGNALGLRCLADFQDSTGSKDLESCTQVEAQFRGVDWDEPVTFTIHENDGHRLEGSFSVSFFDGSTLEADIVARGLEAVEPPQLPGCDDRSIGACTQLRDPEKTAEFEKTCNVDNNNDTAFLPDGCPSTGASCSGTTPPDIFTGDSYDVTVYIDECNDLGAYVSAQLCAMIGGSDPCR